MPSCALTVRCSSSCDRFLFTNRNSYILKLIKCKEVWITMKPPYFTRVSLVPVRCTVHRQSLIQIFSPTRLSKSEYMYSEISRKAPLDDLSAPLVPHLSIECHLHWSIGILATSNKLPLIQFLCRLSCWRKGEQKSMLGAISLYRWRFLWCFSVRYLGAERVRRRSREKNDEKTNWKKPSSRIRRPILHRITPTEIARYARCLKVISIQRNTLAYSTSQIPRRNAYRNRFSHSLTFVLS